MFTTGQSVTYEGMSGFIYFVDEQYVTVCISSVPSNNKRGETCVCLCVYPEQQDKVIVIGDK